MSTNPNARQVLWSVTAVVAAMLSLGVGASIAKTLFAAVGPLGASAYRLLVGCIILMAWFRPWRWSVSQQDFSRILPYGITLGLMNLFFYQALETLPVGLAIAIEFTGPLALAVFASRRRLDFLWAGLAVLGMLMLSPLLNLKDDLDPVGVFFALAAGACWALYILLGRRASALRAGQVTGWGMLIAATMALPLGVAQAGVNLLDPALILVGLAVGLLSSAVPYTLELFALRHLPTKTFGVVLSVEPAFGALAGAIILGERLNLTETAAIACIMLASAGCTASAMRQTNK